MAWSTLAGRLKDLPLVLAGPILRQVTRDAVTVWVALQRTADVTLTVYDSDMEPGRTTLMTATRKTAAVGKNLHIVAVTARAKNALSENHIYFYDLDFSSMSPAMKMSLAEGVTKPGSNADSSLLAYAPLFTLPSFALPPTDLNKLRLVHGSCRKPHGGGPGAADALAILNDLIKDTAGQPLARPHQLVLTGDQIYADEVEDALLLTLTDAGDTLLGWTESMPGVGNNDGPYEAAKLLPTTRSAVIEKAGFTSDDKRSHLMSLGEYLAMYLFAWSEVLWGDLATLDELKAKLPSGVAIATDVANDIKTNGKAIDDYIKTLPDVRRALANVPTYMICDDHEITDDWNMTREFCENVYNSPLGRRIVQNGLIAYAICQAWGNLPEQFADDPQQPPGMKLLKPLDGISKLAAQQATTVYNAFESQFMEIVGLHASQDLLAAGGTLRVYHEMSVLNTIKIEGVSISSTSLRYNFSVEGPSHQIIVTDCRTWRWFLGPGMQPDLIFDQFDTQLKHDVPPLNNRLLLLVFTTNAPPIASIRMFGRIASKAMVIEYDLFDMWEFPSRSFDRLIVAVSNKLQRIGDSLIGSVIFLSGDVHFSFSSRLAYWAEQQRLDDPSGQKQKVRMVVGQLVASSFKNQQEKTVGEQLVGYTYLPPKVHSYLKKLAVVSPNVAAYLYYDGVAPPHKPEAYVGWNLPLTGGPLEVGKLKPGWVSSGETLTVRPIEATLRANLNYLKPVTLKETPHYRYRIDFLTTSQTGQTVPAPPAAAHFDPADRRGSARFFANAARAHVDLWDKGAVLPDCIGYNNIGEIEFVWKKDDSRPDKVDKRVLHTLHWRKTNKQLQPYWALYDVSLNVDDAAYPKIRADKES